MAITTKLLNTQVSIGDRVRITQKVKLADKERLQIFEGMVIAIKAKGNGKTITLRRIGVQKVGIEKIFPVFSPTISEVKVLKKGGKGIRRAKLYFTRNKAKKEIEKIYKREQNKK